MEETVILDFVNAAYDKDERKIAYIVRGLRPELSAILSAWIKKQPFENTDAPKHPMVMPEYEALMRDRVAESTELNKQSGEMYNQAQNANLVSDEYCFLNVLFSAVMFLGAITTKLVRNRARIILSVLSLLMFLGGLIIVFFQMPVAHKG
jgi:hypothetical protein